MFAMLYASEVAIQIGRDTRDHGVETLYKDPVALAQQEAKRKAHAEVLAIEATQVNTE